MDDQLLVPLEQRRQLKRFEDAVLARLAGTDQHVLFGAPFAVDVLGASVVKPPHLPVVEDQAGEGGDFSYFVCRALRPVGRQVKPVWSLRA